MNFKVSAKRNDKWWAFGRIEKNKFGNLQLSMKNTAELKEMVNNGGDWLNFALFEAEDKPRETPPAVKAEIKKLESLDDDEIPF